MATQGGSLRDNIACVFGVKQLQSLLDLTPFYPESYTPNMKEAFFNNLGNANVENTPALSESIDVSDIKSEHELELSDESSNDTNNDASAYSSDVLNSSLSKSQLTQSSTLSSSQKSFDLKKPFDFDGFISSCAHGNGRSTTERQFFYVNSRPCEPNKVMKLVNEMYRSYNPHQSPFVYLNLKMKRSAVDINVTPDKRKLFVDREKHLIEVIKTSLSKIYEKIPSSLKMENTKPESLSNSRSSSDVSNLNSQNSPTIFSSFLNQFVSKFSQNDPASSKNKSSNFETKRKANSSLDGYVTSCKVIRKCSPEVPIDHETEETEESQEELLNGEEELLDGEEDLESKPDLDEKLDLRNNSNDSDVNSASHAEEDNRETVLLGFSDQVPLSQILDISDAIFDEPSSRKSFKVDKPKRKIPEEKIKSPNQVSSSSTVKTVTSVVVDTHFEKVPSQKKSVKINTTLDQIKHLMLETSFIQEANRTRTERVKFRTEINPVFNKKCEEELKKEISKDMFSQMKVIGQFNLGFIITQFEEDLFIVDQHATDEKYNFETLQQTTVLSSQKLVV